MYSKPHTFYNECNYADPIKLMIYF